MTYLLAIVAMLTGPPATQPAPLPADPFQQAATRALRGDYGELADWQWRGYRLGLQRGATASRVLILTQYNGDEPSGKVDGRGLPCTLRVAASNHIPRYAYIWTERSGIRQVLDCGSHANDARAAGLGGTWVDVWFRHARDARRAGVSGWRPNRGAVILP